MELDRLPSMVMSLPLTFWPKHAQVHTWPNFGEISSNIYNDIVFIRYIMVIACCDLDLWLFTLKVNQHICKPKYTCDQHGWKFLHWFLRYGVHNVFGTLPAVTLTFDLLTPKSNKHTYEPIYICDETWLKVPSLVFEIWCSQRFWEVQTQSRTHSHTDRQTRIQCTFGTVFQRDGSIRSLITLLPDSKRSRQKTNVINNPTGCRAYLSFNAILSWGQ